MAKQTKNRSGRPTKYRPKFCKEIIQYFQREHTKFVSIEHYNSKTGGVTTTMEEVACPPPTLYGFAASIGVNKDTILEWSDKHTQFSGALQMAKGLQADFIVSNAMTNRAPASFAKFMMANNFNWSENQKVEHNGKIAITIDEDDAEL